MSRTFKDTPIRVRIARRPDTIEIHVGCPHSDRPRHRRVWVDRTSEMRWFAVQKGTDEWGLASGNTQWRYGAVDESGWEWEPYWTDCDMDVAGGWTSTRCHRTVANYAAVEGYQHRRGLRPPNGPGHSSPRAKARTKLQSAVREFNTFGETEVDVSPSDGYGRFGWWD